MAIGQITQFPITTILEYATSAQYGLSPQLCAFVHDELVDSDLNKPVSEHGIRLLLDALDTFIDYENLGHGSPVFDSNSGLLAYYNGLKATSQYVTAFISADTLFVSGYGDSTSTPSMLPLSGLSGEISVQGGKYQYSDTIPASAIPTTGYLISHLDTDDVLAKVFVKCTLPFEQNGSSYSIGVSSQSFEEPALMTLAFSAPDKADLVPFSYSSAMSAEYYWMPEEGELRIYRYGPQCSSGEIAISQFYDKVVWSPNYGYLIGNKRYDLPTQRFNLDFDYLDASVRVQFEHDFTQYASIAHNHYIYTTGGENQLVIYNNISRYDSKNDTVLDLDRGNLSFARSRHSIAKSAIKAYMIGGARRSTGEVQYTVIDNIQFSNDTANAIHNADLNTARSENYSIQSQYAFYCAGGDNTTNAGPSLSSIEKLSFTTDTSVSTLSISLHTGRERHSGWSINDKGFITCGIAENTSTYVNEVDIVTFSTDSITTYNNQFLVSVVDSSSVQSNKVGYLLGGRTPTTIDLVQKFNFNTFTSSIATGKIQLASGLSSHGYGASV